MTAIDQKKIAANTLLLYVRMIVVMLVGLYTSRVIIEALGKTNFGIYDAVGGIVLMVSFISSTMSGACQRYYSYEMGRGNLEELKKVFSISLSVFLLLTLFIILLGETAGYWWLMHKMDVDGNYDAARWVFQFSILSFALLMLRVPYQGMVIAKEKMKVFAYLSLFEAFATLGIALLLSHTHDDKNFRLILYAGLMSGIQLMTSLFYWFYCRLFYNECRFRFTLDREKFKEVFSYAGWNMIGSCADVCKIYGLSILLNMTFGPLVSAARAVSNKVYNTIVQLNVNFFTAVRPQMYKSYAEGEKQALEKLMCQSTRFSFFLLLLLALPFILETEFILPIWLRGRNVPEHAYILTKLMVLDGVLNCFTEPLATSVQATGNIRNYKIIIGGTSLLLLPLAYVGMTYAGMPPASAYVISVIITVITQVERVWMVKKLVGLDLKNYFRTVLLPIAVVAAISSALSVGAHILLLRNYGDNWIGPVCSIAASMLITTITFYALGTTRTERKHAFEMAMDTLGKLKKQKE